MKSYWLTLFVFGLLSAHTYADDTEIYLGENQAQIKPNIIFVFDTSGSMAEVPATDNPGRKTRLELVKQAALDVIGDNSDDARLKGVNLALMRYNTQRQYEGTNNGSDINYRGGYLLTKMLDIDTNTNRTTIRSEINGLPASGGTPMTESVHEAYNFFTGANINYAKTRTSTSNSWTYLGKTSDVKSGEKYISPITDQCQKNHIVLFTDGDSSVDGESNTQIRSWLSGISGRPTGLSTSCSSNNGGNMAITNSCIEELAYVMYNRTVNMTFNGESAPIQPIQFHAIGGFLEGNSQTFLDKAAEFGKGESGSASNYAELKSALEKIFKEINNSSGTFAAPAVSVNAFNSLQQLDEVYYAVFKPHESIGWSGNVKRLRIKDGTDIVDVNDATAINATTGFFKATSKSFWSPEIDGEQVTKGGMASRLATADAPRKIYSNISGNFPFSLANNSNKVTDSNTNITKPMLGLAANYNNDEFKKIVGWIGGVDTKSPDLPKPPRLAMEDPLHSSPILLTYGQITTATGAKIPDNTLFVGTNSGYLHAFNTRIDAPKEIFAFIPKELLPVASAYYNGSGNKRYGLDGPISILHNDTNKNRVVDNSEKAYLYVGMRRGGRSYYALDVSDRAQPKLLWQISNTTTGFAKLGQTWSKMLPIKIKWNGLAKNALLFAGGYDPAEDNNTVRTAHSMGNAIYLVDAETGALLWKASNETDANLKLTGMTSAITGNVAAVDDNSDGFVDLLYAADLGGRIWRIDINQNATTAASYAKGGVIADLGQDNNRANNVRFFNTPDVVYSKTFSVAETGQTGSLIYKNDVPRYMINIGSGYRAHPLNNEASDNFYVVFDYNTTGAPSAYTPVVTRSDLQTYAASDEFKPTLKSNKGLVIKLINTTTGEKVLAKATTLDDTIMFTTFRPLDTANVAGCSVDMGKSRLYSLKLRAYRVTNAATNIEKNKSTLTTQDLNTPGIPSEGVLVGRTGNNGNNDVHLLISTELIKIEGAKYPLKRTFWRELD